MSKVNEIVKSISEEFFRRVSAGQIVDLKQSHQNAQTEIKYKGFGQITLQLAAMRGGFKSNKWLGFKQVSTLKGERLPHSRYTPFPYSAINYIYNGSSGETFLITADSQTEADEKAKEKEPGATFKRHYFFFKFHRLFNVTQTSLAAEYPATPGYEIVSDPIKARELFFNKLDPKRVYFEKRLVGFIGASFLTLTRPDKDERELVTTWLNKVNEKPAFLYIIASEATKIAEEIINDFKTAKIAV